MNIPSLDSYKEQRQIAVFLGSYGAEIYAISSSKADEFTLKKNILSAFAA
ncbi:hypothetical protein BVRB_4g076680 [Beta vulgaris subsp. vulgaris]|nr:hypothetical protein BVRB_4g076680 [Beta vulgaris subsp. vulgaris]